MKKERAVCRRDYLLQRDLGAPQGNVRLVVVDRLSNREILINSPLLACCSGKQAGMYVSDGDELCALLSSRILLPI